MKIRRAHRFDVGYHEAVAIQEGLRSRVVRRGSVRPLRVIAGADVSYAKRAETMYAAVVVLDWPSLDVVEEVTAERRAKFPYIPGLLSFREMPALLAAFEKLQAKLDVIVCDGHGVAHPRGFGIASHLGVLLDVPTIGCAKKRLVGKHAEPGPEKGSRAPLRLGGRTIGTVLRTRSRVKPVFVSVGHRIGLSSAVAIVLETAVRYRLPEPTRLAHVLSNAARRGELD
jgi:deoxyribonuclease V